ncbi:MAG TPA: hypothetical protein DCW29_04890 [Janthinobacterium sp.]|nr:hypothetical protein [Janthinobacterium sp.]
MREKPMKGAAKQVPQGFRAWIFSWLGPLFATLIFFLGFSLLTWPILLGFEHLSRFIVPYPADS